jgi:hypothetical protein
LGIIYWCKKGFSCNSQRQVADSYRPAEFHIGANFSGCYAINPQCCKRRASQKYLQSGGTISDSTAKASLRKLQTDTQSLYVELLDENRKHVLRAGKKGIQVKVNNDSMLSDLQVAPDSSKVGKIYLIDDSLFYPIVATVTDNKQTIGYLIRWRLIFATAEGMKQFSQLLGTNVKIYVGNADGTVWSDMMKPVQAPPVNVLDTGKYFNYSRAKCRTCYCNVKAY